MALAMGSEISSRPPRCRHLYDFLTRIRQFGWRCERVALGGIRRGSAYDRVDHVHRLLLYGQKLDEQSGEAEEKDEPFSEVSDLGKILSQAGRFGFVALLCVLYYSAIFPFQKYAVNMLQCNLTFTDVPAESFWATDTVTVIQYVIMIVIAIT